MHHTLPSEKTYRSNAVFFTSSKGLVFRPWFEHERLYRARIAIDVVSHSRANLYSPKCLEGGFSELPLYVILGSSQPLATLTEVRMWQFPRRKMGHMSDMQPTSGTLALGRAAFDILRFGYPF